MIDGAEPADNNDIAVLDERGSVFFREKHLLALRAIGAGDRIELHRLLSTTLNTGVSLLLALPTTRALIAGGSMSSKRPSTRRPSSRSTSSSTNGPVPACCLPGTRITV